MRTRDNPELRLVIGYGWLLIVVGLVVTATWEWVTGQPAPWMVRPR